MHSARIISGLNCILANQCDHVVFAYCMCYVLLVYPEVAALGSALQGLQGLSPEQQEELRNRLDDVLMCVAGLRSEVSELRSGLQDIAQKIIEDVK